MNLREKKNRFTKPLVSALIPTFNSESTLEAVIESIENQKTKPREIIVIDDYSQDQSRDVAERNGCRLLLLEKNSGRGKVRNMGVAESNSPFMLFCDSSNIIDPSFTDIALSHFDDPKVAAVFGRIKNAAHLKNPLNRWRGRHLFREHLPYRKDIHETKSLITYAIMLKKKAVMEVGNFNCNLRQWEDQELGDRLIKHGYKIISNPSLCAYSIRRETITSLALRYERWHSDYKSTKSPISCFCTNVKSSVLIFARQDIRNGDFACAALSLLMPFWLLWLRLFQKSKIRTKDIS